MQSNNLCVLVYKLTHSTVVELLPHYLHHYLEQSPDEHVKYCALLQTYLALAQVHKMALCEVYFLLHSRESSQDSWLVELECTN